MKKLVSILLVLAVVGGGGYYFLQQKGIAPEISLKGIERYEIANVVPEEPLIYLELRNTSKNIDNLTSTAFWQRLMEINWDLIFQNGSMNQQDEFVLQVLKTSFESPETNEIFIKFFGKDVAIGIYPVDVDLTELSKGNPQAFTNMLDTMAENFYLITRLGAQAQMAEFVSRSFDQFGEQVTISETEYKDTPIKLVNVQDVPYTFAYARLKDLMVMGVGEDSIKRSIDVFKGDVPSLNNNVDFVQVKNKFVKKTEIIGFTNIDRMLSGFERQFAKVSDFQGVNPDQIRAQMAETFKAIQGFKASSVSGVWSDLLELKLDLIFDVNAMEKGIASFYKECENADNNSLKFIPDNTLAYQWGSCFDLEYYWTEMKAEMAREPGAKGASVTQQIAQYEQMIGLTIEGDVIPAFGDEIGGYIRDITMTQNFPLPELLMFVKIADQAKAENLLGLLTNVPILMLQKENIEGVEINYMSIPMLANVSPGYGFVNDYLLISVNKDLLVSSIQSAQKGGPNLVGNETFKVLNRGLTNKNIGVTYMKMDEVAFKAESILDWVGGKAQANDQKVDAFKSGAEKKLVQIQRRIQEDEQILKERQGQVASLKEEIRSLADEEKLKSKKRELARLERNVAELSDEIQSVVDNAIGLEETIRGYSDKNIASDRQSLFMDEVVYPFIDSLKAVDGVGTVSTIDEDALETRVFIKL